MNRPKTYEEVRLIQLIKESKRLLQKVERQGKIKFYRDALLEKGYDVYFWDTVKKRQKEGRKGYRVCFAYKVVKYGKDGYELRSCASFCHPNDNFDRLQAWEDLYEKLCSYPTDDYGEFIPFITDTKKTVICDALRKGIVHNNFIEKPTLFKKHCKTWLKDV